MQYASYLHHDFIDPLILAKLLDLSDVSSLTNAIDPLLKLSLIDEVVVDSRLGIAVHGVIQKITRDYIAMATVQEDLKGKTLTEKDCNRLMPMVDYAPDEKWDQASEVYKDVENLLKEIDFDNISSEDKNLLKELSSLLRKAGSYNLYVTSTYKQSLEYYKQALQLDRAIYGENSIVVAQDLNFVACGYHRIGDYGEALVHLNKALKTFKQLSLGDHTLVANCLNNISMVYNSLGNCNKALEYMNASYEMYKNIPDSGIDIAISLNNLGAVQDKLGNHKEALKLRKEGLKMSLKLGDKVRASSFMNEIGEEYWNLGKTEESLGYYLQSLQMRQTLYKAPHPDVATSLKKVSDNYGKLGNYKEALHYGELALKMFQELGNESMVASCFNNLGVTYGKVRDNEKAIEYELKSLEIREKLYPGTEVLANTLSNISATYRKLKTYEEALEYELKALEIKETLYPGTEIVATTLGNVGYIYSRLKKHEYALKYELKALDIRQKLYPNNDNKLLADISNNVGYTYDQLGKHKEALKYYKQSYKILDSLENKANFAKYMQNIESKIAVLEGGDLKIQDNADSAVSSVDSIIPDDDSAKDDSEILGEVAPE
ncbi:MAG TPA: tetratricopeptide repeat protein [Candidatus Megaira endosymbiont of Nemacystus decipiens]|nr:tetratricopeptide repeat protein [Candidatus Megaera endosymbiont of Nemacystus decipiens]